MADSDVRYAPILRYADMKEPESTVSSPEDVQLPRIPTWPEEARPLRRARWISVFEAATDVVLIVLPLYFVCE
jgi:hypothetical protein